MPKIQLGDRIRDRVTGFEGIATCRAEYLNGCVQYDISGKADEKGEARILQVDDQQIERVDTGLNKKAPVKKRTGGPSRMRTAGRIA